MYAKYPLTIFILQCLPNYPPISSAHIDYIRKFDLGGVNLQPRGNNYQVLCVVFRTYLHQQPTVHYPQLITA